MAESCPQCGSELSPATPLGALCPHCLMGLGLGAQSGAEGRAPVTAVLSAAGAGHGGGRPTAAAGPPARISAETESLLRGRLQVGAALIFLGLLLFVVRDLVAPEGVLGTTEATRAGLLAFYGAIFAVLRGNRALNLVQLRAIEVAMLWVVALWFAVDRYAYTLLAAQSRNPRDTLWTLTFAVTVYFAILSAYGFFSPNTWKRALRMTGLIAVTPLAVMLIVRIRHPEEARFVMQTVTFNESSSLVLILAIGVMIATWGAHRIHTLRVEAFEARRMGHYHLTERIGVGGMGEVWKAEHQLLARPAAVKLIRPEVIETKDPALAHDVLGLFEREAQATAALRSTHTVELYDFGITRDQAFYYVMELLDGLDLETLVKEHGPMSPQRVVALLEQVCDSLADAHANGMVHRDIKPANIYVCRMGRRFDFVKVLDFGLVRLSSERHRKARWGAAMEKVAGTPAYMAPEQASGEFEIDGRADIYSLGCVGHWMLTGRPVFEGASTGEVVDNHVSSPVTPPSERTVRQIPEPLERIVLQCLEKNPARRPPSAERLAAMLNDTELAGSWSQEDAEAWWAERDRIKRPSGTPTSSG